MSTTSAAADAVRSAVEQLNAGNLEGYLASLHPNSERWVPGATVPVTRDVVEMGLRQLHGAFSGLHLAEDLLFGDERYACAQWRLQGVHTADYAGVPATGRTIDAPTCEVYTVEDGLITTSWVYGDLAAVYTQISSPAGTQQ